MRIAITGSTGLIGSHLRVLLEGKGSQVLGISRSGGDSSGSIRWDPGRKEIDEDHLTDLNAFVHLAGENIASGRWTKEQRKKIRDSRVEGTRFLVETMCNMKTPPDTFVCASAIGYYGSRGEEVLDETSDPGSDFLAEVCEEWEAACKAATEMGIRTINLRIGVVLSSEGGALGKMLLPFKLGLGGRVGSGNQYLSWIGIDDAVAGIEHCLRNEKVRGPINLVSPNPVTNNEFTKTLGKVLNRPTILPVPSFALEWVLGKMAAQALLLSSTRVLPTRLTESDFGFQYPGLEDALRHLLGRI